jgi:hypothetical protein
MGREGGVVSQSATKTKPTRIRIVKVDPAALISLSGHPSVKRKIAPGFKPNPKRDLKFMSGKTIANLSFKSFYLDANRWNGSDAQNIDQALSGAMSDANLNNVIAQYYPNGTPVRTNFLGSSKIASAVGATFTRDDVNPTIEALITSGALAGVDFDTTVVCLFLPPGAILSTDAVGGVGKLKGDDDNMDDSTQGLGGYHGSCHIGAQRVYFAVGVYSQMVNGSPNGIPVWPDSWKNIVATFYHELNEARTDPDVEDAERDNNDNLLGWYNNTREGGEIGDIPMNEAGQNLRSVMVEVALAAGGTAPIQLMWSNAVHGPEGPFAA